MNEKTNRNATGKIEPDTKKCKFCKHFDYTGARRGECRRCSPAALYADGCFMTNWPPVETDDWCSQFEAKPTGGKENA